MFGDSLLSYLVNSLLTLNVDSLGVRQLPPAFPRKFSCEFPNAYFPNCLRYNRFKVNLWIVLGKIFALN